ncbi:unnamed protein product, partial [Rotaria sp. Silwood2]
LTSFFLFLSGERKNGEVDDGVVRVEFRVLIFLLSSVSLVFIDPNDTINGHNVYVAGGFNIISTN